VRTEQALEQGQKLQAIAKALACLPKLIHHLKKHI
jgi:hypothetical protein